MCLKRTYIWHYTSRHHYRRIRSVTLSPTPTCNLRIVHNDLMISYDGTFKSLQFVKSVVYSMPISKCQRNVRLNLLSNMYYVRYLLCMYVCIHIQRILYIFAAFVIHILFSYTLTFQFTLNTTCIKTTCIFIEIYYLISFNFNVYNSFVRMYLHK